MTNINSAYVDFVKTSGEGMHDAGAVCEQIPMGRAGAGVAFVLDAERSIKSHSEVGMRRQCFQYSKIRSVVVRINGQFCITWYMRERE